MNIKRNCVIILAIMLNLLLTSLTTGANIVKKFKKNKNDDYDITFNRTYASITDILLVTDKKEYPFLLLHSYESIGLISLCKVMNVIYYYCYIFIYYRT